jgi:hypothetical protein
MATYRNRLPTSGYDQRVRSPWFAADFDSATALVRALAASLRGRRFRRLGHGQLAGAATTASSVLPESIRALAFAIAGGTEAIPPRRLADVSPEVFAQWVASEYPDTTPPAIAIGSADGAVMHLCAATGIPWLPQTFLVPVARRADPDTVSGEIDLGRRIAPPLLAAQPSVRVHHMHDPNQDRLMVSRLAYFRLKMLRLPAAYRHFIERRLPTGGTIVIVDDKLTWPSTAVDDRHVFQAGAVGGLAPDEYRRRWDFPSADGNSPEAEWGYAPELTTDIERVARERGHRVVHVSFAGPGAASPHVADLLHEAHGEARRLLVETFICVEPEWALRTGTVPFWTPFPVKSSLSDANRYLDIEKRWQQIVVTLFTHGVRSEGLASAAEWQRLADRGRDPGVLAGVNARHWPVDFAALARYSGALEKVATPAGKPARVDIEVFDELAARCGQRGGTRSEPSR